MSDTNKLVEIDHVREKLLKLIGQVQDWGVDVTSFDEPDIDNEVLADHLLDNGVTFQEPIPVKTYNDLLNSMSIEEKAAFIPYICRNARKVHPNAKRYRPTELVRVCLKSEYTCSECLLHFLRHPVEGEIIHG